MDYNMQVLLVPSAFTKVTGQAHWEILLRARAIETQCYVWSLFLTLDYLNQVVLTAWHLYLTGYELQL